MHDADATTGPHRWWRGDVALTVTGVVAGLLANYWMLEGLLAEHVDPAGMYISDLGARGEGNAWVFNTLDVLSGVAMIVLAWLLWPRLPRVYRSVRIGLWGLVLGGICSMIDGVATRSCNEALPTCVLKDDLMDHIHTWESLVATVAGVLSFAMAKGLLAEPRHRVIGVTTVICGALWIIVTAILAIDPAGVGLDQVAGVFQRQGQAIYGLWMALLAAGTAYAPAVDYLKSERVKR